MSNASNSAARNTWEAKAVGSQRANAAVGSPEYFDQIREYRYGYETPWLPRVMGLRELSGKRVLEIGVGHGIDGVEMASHGASYSGIDITQNHLRLAKQNFDQHKLPSIFYEGDLIETDVGDPYDVVYSFGVLHHIAHEDGYLRRIREIVAPGGELRIAVYSAASFFNAYLIATHRLKAAGRPLDDWRSHLSEGSPLGQPVTIKIRRRREVENLIRSSGWQITRYDKCGFVQNYLPVIGKHLAPEGVVLNIMGRLLGWYHCFRCRIR